MAVIIKLNESLEDALKRFKTEVKRAGVISDYMEKTAFKTKHERQRDRQQAANKKRTRSK